VAKIRKVPVLLPKHERGVKLSEAARSLLHKCIHFTGLSNGHCSKGIAYKAVEIHMLQVPGKYVQPYPCLNPSVQSCQLRELPTYRQAQKMAAQHSECAERAVTALVAINDYCRSHDLTVGEIRCPNCEQGTLKFHRAGPRSLQAVCSTQGCTKIVS
jgi:hypothetical protein